MQSVKITDYEFVTAGVWARVGDRFPFEFGPDKTGEKLGVVRVGGHVEAGETPWACAVREAKEEAVIDIAHVDPPATYRVDIDKDRTRLERVVWDVDPAACVAPAMVRIFGKMASPIFLATTQDAPKPGPETHGLLMLSLADIALLQREELTLREFVAQGGQALVGELALDFDMSLKLSDVVLALARVAGMHPEIA